MIHTFKTKYTVAPRTQNSAKHVKRLLKRKFFATFFNQYKNFLTLANTSLVRFPGGFL